ncbi:lytic transglycosylase domain-containing protein [Neisseria weixii]|uniref:Lytic transglycosylase domain-containing protein n=1 Tax=Neisseria weixii TaxID=1853276 RepID=A0A3N4N7N8_9NEIS|nr:lytic transglycosylase domain-containing protein [Neisseria weixii]RPD90177.1 lytic transglycosylase domain-containing protein [Neisseria weixii]RPD90250.1 lytic transglycosylase domain-containing protein [Neisseria weixii]
MRRKVFLTVLLLASVANAEKLTFPQYAVLVEKHAAAQRLDPKMIWAVMGRESSGNPNALSHKNARGLMQVIPPTAARMGVNPKHLYQPEPNLIAGTRYLRFLCNRYPDKNHPTGCNIDLVLAGYNAGEGAVDKYRGIPPYAETRAYVKNVKYRYARLSNNPSLMTASFTSPVKPSAKPKMAVAQVETATAVPVAMKRRHEAWDVFQEF